MYRPGMISRSVFIILMVFLFAVAGHPVQAVPTAVVYLVVDTTSDDLSKDDCTTADNDCSLRGAVEFVNHALPGPEYFISIPAGTYSLTLTGSMEDNNQTGDLDFLGSTVHLVGAGSASTILDGQSSDRVLDNHDAALTVEHMKINWGTAPEGGNGGGGIINRGSTHLYVDDVVIMNNTVAGANEVNNEGGGISNYGILSVNNSIIRVNDACRGGGIYNSHANLSITNTTIFMNTARSGSPCGRGGGIFNEGPSSHLELYNVLLTGNNADNGAGLFYQGATSGTITDTTISDNLASSYGGGLENSGTLLLNRVTLSGNDAHTGGGGGISNTGLLTLNNVTISGNSSQLGGGIYAYGTGSISMDHSTVANNAVTGSGWAYYAYTSSVLTIHNTILASTNSGDTCHLLSGSITNDLGYNLSSDNSCNFSHDPPFNDWPNQIPDLYALADNGGSTWTMALNPMSTARDHADPATTQTRDQRGYYRPVNGDALPGAISDIGAFEADSFPLPYSFWFPAIFVSIYIV
jgi:hypothetical protein